MGHCITGWLNYFRHSPTYQALVDLDHWLRRRVRMGLLKAGNSSAIRRQHVPVQGIPRA
ncbi:MAG: group II intron maturase-specific domain-containing protein [Gemmatimonadota bacterium]|nr:group II intron maturase-specific domain-containing protein [Gemmatimonadota bacterium]